MPYLHQLFGLIIVNVLLFVDMLVKLFVNKVVLLYVWLSSFLVASVVHLSLMQAPLTTLSECFLTVADATLKWFLPSVGEIVFYEVLLESKAFPTLITNVVFNSFVDFHVPFETVLGLENLVTIEDITPEFFCRRRFLRLYWRGRGVHSSHGLV